MGIHLKNIKSYSLFTLLLLAFTFVYSLQAVIAQSGLCNNDVPFFVADLSSSPSATWVSPSIARKDNCCGTSFPDRCIEFSIILHPNAIGINFTIASGAQPPGALFYQINCGPPIPVGSPICLPGQGPHTLTFCKPGSNQNTYAITSIPKPEISPPQIATENCPAHIWATDYAPGTMIWQDVTYNGQYNNYLNCDTCDSVTVTPSTGFPPYVDFEVCGTPLSLLCQGIITHCDTVRVYFYDTVVPFTTPDPAMYCMNEAGVIITGAHNGGVPPFNYQWFNQYSGNGTIVGTGNQYFANAPGSYSLVVYDSLYPNCPEAFYNFDVTENPTYEFPQLEQICNGEVFNWRGNDYITSGTYFDSLLTDMGCDSVYILTLTVNPVFEFINTVEICEGEVYTWRGHTYSLTGVYYDSLTTVNGCDSIFVLDLTVNPTYEFTENANICYGGQYFWRGNIYTLNGTYYDNLLTASGCDSVYMLNLIVYPVYEFIDNTIICNGETYFWQGNSYTNTGTYYNNLQTINGCDSIFILNLTVNNSYEFTEFGEICNGETFIWRGNNYTSPGPHYDSLLTANGCDSVFILDLTVHPSYEIVENGQICTNDIYIWRGNTYNTIGTYYDSLLTTYGCDSVYVLNLEVNPIYQYIYNEEICNGEVFYWHGQNYTLSGTYTDFSYSIDNCDSIYILYLTVNPVYEFTDVIDVCVMDYYTWHGQNYTQSGIYYDSLTTANGCDSVWILNLTLNLAYEFTLNENICDGELFTWHGNTYSSSGIFYDSLLTYQNCDSVYILNLTVFPVYEFTNDAVICDGDIYIWRNLSFTTSGTYYDSIQTANGCDSVFVLNLTVNPVYEFIENINICSGDNYYWRGNTYNNTGIYYDSLFTNMGCDSVYVLNLTVNTVYQFTENEEICEGEILYWHGFNLTTSGVYYDSLITTFGCDSIYMLNLTVNNSYEFTQTANICLGDDYFWRGNIYNASGYYYDSLMTSNACDSIYVLELTVSPVYVFAEYHEICQGEFFNWHGQNYTATGAYYDSLITINGCDSIFFLNLTVNPTYEFTENAGICNGGQYFWRGNNYTQTGIFYDSLQTVAGCDSVFILDLIVYPVYEFTDNTTICNGETYAWQGNSYTNTGTYYNNLQTINGCDSIFILNLTVNNSYEFTEYGEICNGETFIWRGNNYTSPGPHYDSLLTVNGCDSVFVLELTVNQTYQIVENGQICTDDVFLWHGNNYDSSGTYYDSLQTIHGCDSIHILNLAVNPVYQFIFNEAICDGEQFFWRGNFYSVTGTYIDSSLSVFNCDSAYILNLTVHPVYQFTDVIEVCVTDHYTWHGQNYTQSGIYYDSLTTANGCDSVWILNLTLNLAYEFTQNENICDGEIFMWHGNIYNSSGVYYDSLLTYQNCDSVYILNLTVFPVYEFTNDAVICDGDIYIWRNLSFTTSGTYYDSLQTVHGCDSVFVLNLTVNPVYEFIEDVNICSGDSYFWRGNTYSITGTYYDSLFTNMGCDSVYILNLTVNPIYLFTENDVICINDNFYWHGLTITSSGVYYDSLLTTSGCDSIYMLNLTVYNSYEFSETAAICSGDDYFWRGNTFDNPGFYYDSLLTSNACDSVYILELIVYPVYETTQNIQICDGDYYTWQGTDYSAEGTYQLDFLTINGCDSVFILNLDVNAIYEEILNASVCDGDIYIWRGNPYTTPGTYYDTVHPPVGCDSIFILNLSVNIPYEFQEYAEICQGDFYYWRGATYNNAGTYYDSLLTVDGCDSVFILNLEVNPVFEFTDNVEICDVFMHEWHGNYYWLTGTYYDSLQTINGCDSVYILNLTLTPSYEFVEFADICQGDSFIWRGNSFYSSGVYFDSLLTSNSCDSVFALVLNIHSHFEIIENIDICDGSVYFWHGNTYNTQGTYYDSLTSIYGCDSIHVMNLTYHLPSEYSQNETICDGETYIWHGNSYTLQGIYYDSLSSIYGCDSVYILNLIVNPSFEYSENETICNGDIFTWHGSSYTLQGTYYDSLVSMNGCDSVYILNLDLMPTPSISINSTAQVVCNGNAVSLEALGANTYTWSNGMQGNSITVYPMSNTIYAVTGTDNNGCSSTSDISVNVFVTPPVSAGPGGDICPGESFQLNGSGAISYDWYPAGSLDNPNIYNPVATPGSTTTYYMTGLVQGVNIIQNGDFSMGNYGFTSQYYYSTDLWPEGNYYVTTNPQAHQSLFSPCGDHTTGTENMMVVNGAATPNQQVWCQNIQIAPNYDYIFSTWLTSVHPNNPAILQFSINGVLLGNTFGTTSTTCNWQQFYETWNSGINTTAEICIVNQNTIQNGNDFAIDDIYFSPLCPLTDSVTVIVNESYDMNENHSICDNEIYNWQGSIYNTTGTYVEPFNTMHGCDSIHTLNLTVNSTFDFVENQMICDGDSYYWQGNSYSAAGTYNVFLNSTAGCDSTYTLNLSLNPNYNFSENQTICEGDSFYWHGNQYYAAGTYNEIYNTVSGCDSTFILNLFSNAVPLVDIDGNLIICQSDSTILTATGGISYLWSTGDTSSVIVVQPNSGITYSVTATNANACTANTSVQVIVNPLPQVTAGNDQIICYGQSVNFSAYGGNAYEWSIGATSQSINVSPATTTTYTVTATDQNGCSASDDVVATVNPLPIIQAGPDTLVCIGNNVQLHASGGADYSWQPISNLNDPLIATPITSTTVSTTYTVTVADNNGCSNTDDVIVVINPLPQASAGNDQYICFGDSAILIAGGGLFYEWSTGQTTSVIHTSPPVFQVYTVTVTDANNCSQTDDVNVTVYTLPIADAGNDTSICVYDSIQLNASGGISYIWSPISSLNISIINNPTAFPLQTTNYTVIVTDSNGCVSNDDVLITVHLLPQVYAGGHQSVCLGDSAQFTATGGIDYIWDNGINAPVITVSPPSSTSYTVTVTDANGCSNTDAAYLNINPLPVADAGNDTSICAGSSVHLFATGGNNYLWSPAGSLNANNIYNPIGTPAINTLYTVTVTDINGCSDIDDVFITILPNPSICLVPESFNGCAPLTVTFNDTNTTGISTWLWNFGDPSSTSNTSTQQNPIHTYNNAGNYNVTLTLTSDYGCTSSAQYNGMITVYPLPDASFEPNPAVTDLYQTIIYFNNSSTGSVAWFWNFGDDGSNSNFSFDFSPTHKYNEAGTYTVLLIVTSQDGCLDSTTRIVIINPEFTFFIPNVFTPNGDGLNDFFQGFGTHFTEYQMYIFDRWGELTYETNNYNEPWNGKYWNVKEITFSDVFVYKFIVKDFSGKEHVYIGHITLLK